MFLENSRYFSVATVTTDIGMAGTVSALKRRLLESPSGELYEVVENNQLDVLAYQQYSDGTKFWHIADANTELEASDLLAQIGAVILKPTS